MTSVGTDAIQARHEAEAEAADRFAHLRSGTASDRDRNEIETWRIADPLNDAAWTRVAAIWDGSRAAAREPAVEAMRAAALSRRASSNQRPELRWRPMAMAASIAVLLAAGGLLGTQAGWWSGGETRQVADWSSATRTAVGERRMVQLADGSKVVLNTDSALRTRFSKNAREVRLDSGEAYFNVAKDTARPFTVTTDRITTTAIGTAFSVRRDTGGVVVTLTEGRLHVETADRRHSATLIPGQQLHADPAGFTVRAIDVRRSMSWTSGSLDFDNVPLSTAIGEVNRYGKRHIVLLDDRLGSVPVTGRFEIGKPEAFVDMLTAAGKARVARTTEATLELKAP